MHALQNLILTPVRTHNNMTIMIIEAIGRTRSLSLCANACVCFHFTDAKTVWTLYIFCTHATLKMQSIKMILYACSPNKAIEIPMTLNLRYWITHSSFTASLRCVHRKQTEINYKVATVSISIASISNDSWMLHCIHHRCTGVFFGRFLSLSLSFQESCSVDMMSCKRNKIRFILIISSNSKQKEQRIDKVKWYTRSGIWWSTTNLIEIHFGRILNVIWLISNHHHKRWIFFWSRSVFVLFLVISVPFFFFRMKGKQCMW